MWNAQYNPANPYAQLMQGSQLDNGSAQQMYGMSLHDAAMRRQQEEDERQRQSMNSGSNDLMEQFMNNGSATTTTTTLPSSAMGGGTLQASMSAPLAQAAPLASQTGIGGGAVVGPMSQAPVAGMSMAPGGTAAGTMGGMAAPTAVGAGTGGVAAGGGAGAGAAGAGTAAGATALGMASVIGLPIAAGLGAAQWTNNTHDDVNWGTHFTDPNKAHGALGENMDDIGTRWFGNNTFGKGMGAAISSPSKVIAPSSPGEWVEGVGDLLLVNQTAEGLGSLWRGLQDLF